MARAASLLVSLLLLTSAACSKGPKQGATADPVATTSLASVMTSAHKHPGPPLAVSANPQGALPVRWQVAPAASAKSDKLAVTLHVGGQALPAGELLASTDDAISGSPKACSLLSNSSTSSSLACGGIAAYNFVSATLEGGQLVVTRTSGNDQTGAEQTTEISHFTVTGTSLQTQAFQAQ